MTANLRIFAAALTLLTAATAPVFAQKSEKTGEFHELNAPTTGTASLAKSGNTYTVKLTDLKTAVGPGLQVWLYEGAAPAKGVDDKAVAVGKHIVVGDLKTFSGDFSFAVPAGTKVAKYRSVVLWCESVKTSFAAAPLQ